MKTYVVTGEYGIQEGQYEQRTYKAQNVDNARKRFIREVRPTVSGLTWIYMRMNISVMELVKC